VVVEGPAAAKLATGSFFLDAFIIIAKAFFGAGADLGRRRSVSGCARDGDEVGAGGVELREMVRWCSAPHRVSRVWLTWSSTAQTVEVQ
jgi:hypothetical protein